MSNLAKWLPGCYRNFPSKPGEALPGYLLRLAEANGYANIIAFLKAAGIDTRSSLPFGYSSRIRTNSTALDALGCVAVGDPEHLRRYEMLPLGTTAYLLHDCRVDIDALLEGRSQVCPLCLIEDGFIREELELAPVTVCSTHHVLLVDECMGCRHTLNWRRSHLMACDVCGADLRSLTAKPVGTEVCEVAEDFAALARFRFVLHGDTQTEIWDAMFKVFKAMALPDAVWALGKWPRRLVQTMSVAARHKSIEHLARTRRRGSYYISELYGRALSVLAPLNAIPRPFLLEKCAIDMIVPDSGLMPEFAEAMCSEKPPPKKKIGAELFQGRPPSLRTPDEVISFLAIDLETFDALITRRILTQPAESELGYDIDEILNAQSFLQMGVLTLSELSTLVGVPLDWDDLIHSILLKTWNPRKPSDRRVAVDDVMLIQQRLMANLYSNSRPDNAVSVRDVAMHSERPFQTVSTVVMRACRGDLSLFGWEPPYDWASLLISENDAEELLPSISRGDN